MKSLKSLSILLMSIGLIYACTNSDTSSSSSTSAAPTTKEPIKISNNGVFINHQSYGEGTYTLLFVHGWCINQSYWEDQVKALSNDYRVVTIDLPGFGDSGKDKSDWSMASFGADIKAVIDQLQLSNVILIGHSMGGDVILEAALDNDKVIALIGVDNFKDVGMDYGQEVEAQIDEFLSLIKDNFVEVAPAYAAGNLFHNSTDSLDKNRVLEDIRKANPQTAYASLEGLFEYAPVEPTQLSKLNKPLFLINSNATPTYTAGLDATGVKYEVIDIDSTGHYPMIEKPMIFNNLLKQAIQKIKVADKWTSPR